MRGKILLVGVVLLAVFGLVGALWFSSDADLRAEDAAARAAGLPATWAEAGVVLSPPEVIARVTRVRETVNRWPSFPGVPIPGEERTWYWPQPGDLPPIAVKHWLDSLPAEEVQRVIVDLDGAISGPVELRIGSDVTLEATEPQCDEKVLRWLVIRLVCEEGTQVQQDVRRVFKVLSWRAQRGTHYPWGLVTNEREFALFLTSRVEYLRKYEVTAQVRGIAAQMRGKIVDSLQASRLHCRQSCFGSSFLAFWSRQSFNELSLPESLMGIPIADKLRFFPGQILLRSGRQNLLEFQREALQIPLSTTLSDRVILEIVAKVEMQLCSIEPWHIEKILTRFVVANDLYRIRQTIRTAIHIDLAAAILSNEPWPEDPCAPPGQRLQPIVRDGRIIGAYSLGPDGRDDGGQAYRDWCYPISERLGSPKASDPPSR